MFVYRRGKRTVKVMKCVELAKFRELKRNRSICDREPRREQAKDADMGKWQSVGESCKYLMSAESVY